MNEYAAWVSVLFIFGGVAFIHLWFFVLIYRILFGDKNDSSKSD